MLLWCVGKTGTGKTTLPSVFCAVHGCGGKASIKTTSTTGPGTLLFHFYDVGMQDPARLLLVLIGHHPIQTRTTSCT